MGELPVLTDLAVRQPGAPATLCGARRMVMAAVPACRRRDPAAPRWRRQGWTGAGLRRARRGAALERPALVAEIIGHVRGRGEVLRPRRRLDRVRRRGAPSA